MPRKSIDYSKTIIYKLVCNNVNIKDCYVGATTNFNKRKAKHKINCNTEKVENYNLKVYVFIRDNGGFNNWSMIMIEKYSCNDKLESDTRERYWLETLGATLNTQIPSRKIKEYQKDNAERLAEYQVDYRAVNKEQIAEKKQDYYEKNKDKVNKKIICECGSIIIKRIKNTHYKSQKHLNYIN